MSNRRQRRAVRKKSPHSLPATMQDVERAKRVATDETMDMVITIVLSALLNGGFLDKDQIPDAWKSIDYLSDSITKGYVTVADLRRALRDEEEISVK